MEGNESGLNSYYHHHQQHANSTSINGGLFSNPNSHFSSSDTTSLVFPPHSVPARSTTAPPASAPEAVRRKRGRPRKYGPGGMTDASSSASANASSGKKAAVAGGTSASLPLSSSPAAPKKKEGSSATKKAQLDALGNAGQGFTPHVITVAAGEDVAQKIMSFVQQRKRAVCILSASGSISNASLSQPATLGGNVTCEGRFEILSLSGSFLHAEIGGASSRTGGLSVCLSGADGRIVGGGLGGPLEAAGPVQVIAGSFMIDDNKDSHAAAKIETSTTLVGQPISPVSFRSISDSSTRISARSNDNYQNIGASNFMLQRAMHAIPSRPMEWTGGHIDPDSRSDVDIELTGRSDGGHVACQSPEDGDDEHIRD